MDFIQALKTRIDEDPQFSWHKKIALKRGEFLKLPDTTDTNLYYVTSGCLRAYLENDQGEQTIRFGYTGNIFAALDSFISEQNSPMALQALRKSEVLVIGKQAFLDFIELRDTSGAEPRLAVSEQLSELHRSSDHSLRANQANNKEGAMTNLEIWSQLQTGLIFGMMERELDLLTTSPQERYQRILERSPHLFQLVPAKYIANYLRMSPETLSRLQK
jgi:CRP-like cAMP-binding protein